MIAAFHRVAPVRCAIIFERMPPMLCPTSTVRSNDGSLCEGSTTLRMRSSDSRSRLADEGIGSPVG